MYSLNARIARMLLKFHLDVTYNTDYWGDGGYCTCPECEKEIELDGYEYD